MAGASTPSIADGRSPPITPINGPTSQTRNMGVNGSDLREAKTASDSIETATGVPNSKNGEYARSDASRPSSNSISDEHALNFEYIRNVIMQFLEHKEMRVSIRTASPRIYANATAAYYSRILCLFLASFSTLHQQKRGASRQKQTLKGRATPASQRLAVHNFDVRLSTDAVDSASVVCSYRI